jgi:hypothetical protein
MMNKEEIFFGVIIKEIRDGEGIFFRYEHKKILRIFSSHAYHKL